MDLQELYRVYGELMIQKEIVEGRIVEVKTKIQQIFLEDAEGGFTFGFGLHLNVNQFEMNLDYASIDYGRFDYVNKFSFIFTF